jgi:hypothetical protein
MFSSSSGETRHLECLDADGSRGGKTMARAKADMIVFLNASKVYSNYSGHRLTSQHPLGGFGKACEQDTEILRLWQKEVIFQQVIA